MNLSNFLRGLGRLACFCLDWQRLRGPKDRFWQAIYWGYLGLRAQKLSLPFNSPEETSEAFRSRSWQDLVLVRLACLARVQDQKDYESLRLAWKALGDREQISLTDHFLADGIEVRSRLVAA